MKTLLPSIALAALALGAVPAAADPLGVAARVVTPGDVVAPALSHDEIDRRGRGHGGHGGRPRVPGGSGCDDPHDVVEHPECRVQ